MRLLLIRHGQTPSNVDGVLDAAYPGPGLTALGRAQAEAVPEALRGEDIAGIHVSRLLRTHETAAPLAAALGHSPSLTEGLQEISAGELQGRREQEAVEAYHRHLHRWATGDLADGLPGGESGEAFRARYLGALRHIAALHDEDATVAVVSHGAAIRVFAALTGAVGEAELAQQPLFNTGMVTLVGHPDRAWALEDWTSEPIGGSHLLGDASHDVTADEDADAAV